MTSPYLSFDEMWKSALRSVMHRPAIEGTRNGDTREVIGYGACLLYPQYAWLCNERRALSPYYAAAEVLWYMSGNDSIDMIKHYAPQYVHFAEADGKAHGAYGRRLIDPIDQMSLVIDELTCRQYSRQVVVRLWKETDLETAGKKRDVPCTLTWQFLLRDNKLHMVVSMRSNDIWLGMPYDVFAFTCIQQAVAWQIGADVGTYTHFVGSLHAYEKNWDAIKQAMKSKPIPIEELWTEVENRDSLSSLRAATRVERSIRVNGICSSSYYGLGDMSKTFVNLCARCCDVAPDDQSIDPLLRKAAELHDRTRRK